MLGVDAQSVPDEFHDQRRGMRMWSPALLWREVIDRPDPEEAAQIGRARRQGLLLMAGSALASLTLTYGVWTLVAHLI